MKKGNWFKLFSLLFYLCVIVTTLSSCNNKDIEPQESNTYYTSFTVKYSPNGNYSGKLFFDDNIDDSFKDFDVKNFTLCSFTSVGEDKASANLNDFNVKKIDNKNIELTFKSPFNYNDDVSYVLSSNKAVTTKDFYIMAIVYVIQPEPELDINYEGLYKGTSKSVITATLGDGWKFSDEITSDMLKLPEGFNASVNVVRESDSKIIFTITNIPTNYSGVVLEAVLSKNAFKSEFAKDVNLSLDFIQPSITIDPSTISYDEESGILNVGKVIIPEGIKGLTNGITSNSSLYSVLEQAYNEKENYYSFKLQISNKVMEKNNVNSLLSYVAVNATLKTVNDEFKYKFYLSDALAGISGNVTTDFKNGKVYMEISPYNATFDLEKISENINITGKEGLTNFKLSTASADKVVYVADYLSELKDGVLVTFSINGNALNTNFKHDNYSIMLYVNPYVDERALEWADIGKGFAKSALSGLASDLATSIVGYVLPYIYEWLGADTSNPEINSVKNSITNLSYAINDLSSDIKNLSTKIETGTNRTILDNFQSIETSLLTSTLKLLSDQDVIKYVDYLKNLYGENVLQAKEEGKAKKDFEAFYDYCDETLYITYSLQNVISLYNDLLDCVKSSIDFVDFSYSASFFPQFSHYEDEDRCGEMIDFDVYNLLINATEYHPSNLELPKAERNEKFEQAVKELNYNNSFVNNVVDYSNRILNNAGGTSGGIIDLYFQVIDSLYNFESQTVAPKRAFVAKTQALFLTSAAIALQYCDATGDVGNAGIIRQRISEVMDKISAAFKKIEGIEEVGKKGNDKILVSGQIVSKTMAKTTATKDTKDTMNGNYLEGVESVSEQTYRSMISRAKARDLSLAEDLKAAGFKNVDPVSNDNYLYMTSSFIKRDISSRIDALRFLVYSSDAAMYRYEVTTVGQNGKGDAVINRNEKVIVNYLHCEILLTLIFKGQKAVYSYNMPYYNLIIGFAPANK